MDDPHVQVIADNYDWLTEKIQLKTTTLWQKLISKKVFIIDDVENIKQTYDAERDQVQAVLQKVRRSSQDTYHAFREALCETGQRHIVDRCLREFNASQPTGLPSVSHIQRACVSQSQAEGATGTENRQEDPPSTITMKSGYATKGQDPDSTNDTEKEILKRKKECELAFYKCISKRLKVLESEPLEKSERHIVVLNSLVKNHIRLFGMQTEKSLLWTLQPLNVEAVDKLWEMYESNVLQTLLTEDMKPFNLKYGLENEKLEVSISEHQFSRCKEEILLGDLCHSSLVDIWKGTSPPPSASHEDCLTCVTRLAERHLLVTSPYIATYLRDHEPLLLKLGHLAYTQYLTREDNLQRTAEACGYSLFDKDIQDLGLLTIPQEISSYVSFVSEEVKGWLAATYCIHRFTEENTVLPYYESVEALVNDVHFHQCLVNYRESFIRRIVAHIDIPNKVPSNIRLQLDRWIQLKRFKLLNLGGSNLHGRGWFLGQLMTAMPKMKKLNLSRTKLEKTDIDDMVEAVGDAKLQVEEIEINDNNLRGAGASLGKLMVVMSSCKHWNLAGADLEADDIMNMVHVIGDVKLQAEDMNMNGNNLRGAGYALGSSMVATPFCKHWNLKGTKLEPADLDNMAHVMRNFRLAIQILEIFPIDLRGAGSSLGRLMLALPHCKQWNLGRAGIDASDLNAIEKSLGDFKLYTEEINIQVFHLHGAGSALGGLMVFIHI